MITVQDQEATLKCLHLPSKKGQNFAGQRLRRWHNPYRPGYFPKRAEKLGHFLHLAILWHSHRISTWPGWHDSVSTNSRPCLPANNKPSCQLSARQTTIYSYGCKFETSTNAAMLLLLSQKAPHQLLFSHFINPITSRSSVLFKMNVLLNSIQFIDCQKLYLNISENNHLPDKK